MKFENTMPGGALPSLGNGRLPLASINCPSSSVR
jgi:hypothetical protein